MPKVPKYSASIDQKVVPSGPRRNVAQAGMIGRAVAGFGQTVSKVVRVREQTLVRDYMTGLLGWQQEFDAEYQSRKGSDAWGIADELKNEYEGRYKGIDKLSWSSGAKDALKRKVTVFRGHAINKAAGYVAIQDRVFKIKADENKARQTVDYAQANYNNLTLIDELLADYEISANDTYYDELAEAKIQAVKDKVWDAVITRAMLDDPELAKEILDEHRDDLSADTEERLGEAIKTALGKQDIQRKANELYASLYKKHSKDPDAALIELRDPKYDREVAEKVKLIFRGIQAQDDKREAEQKQVETEEQEKLHESFTQLFAKGDLDADTVLNSNYDNKLFWLDRIEKRAKAILAGKKDPFEIHDPKLYHEWSDKVTNSPESIKSTDEIWAAVDNTKDAEALSKRWTAWKKGEKASKPKLDPVMSDLHKDGAQRIGRARVAEEFDEETAGRLNLKWDLYIEDVRTGKIKAAPAEVLEYFEELIGPEKESAIKEFLLNTLRNTLRYGPLVGPVVPLLRTLAKEEIGEKTDEALGEALGNREQAIQALKDGGYEVTEGNIQEALRQIRDRE